MKGEFRDNEIIKRGPVTYPVVGGRLRLAHEEGLVCIQTEPVHFQDREAATVKAIVVLLADPENKVFMAHGTASMKRDGARMQDSLLELAETRAVARALRYAGFGVEFTGAEEVPDEKPKQAAQPDRPAAPGKVSVEQARKLRTLASRLSALTGQPLNVEPPKTSDEADALAANLEKAIADLEASGAGTKPS